MVTNTHAKIYLLDTVVSMRSVLHQIHNMYWKKNTYLLTYLLTKLSPSWGAANCAATQKPPSNSWNPKVQYRVHKSPPLIPILNHINPIHSIPSYLRSILILSTHPRLGLPSGLFPSDFPTNILYAFLSSQFVLHAPPISSFFTWSF
jgi:hypothetical protein